MNNLVTSLRILLASNFVLYLKTHMCHWNVTGPCFFELHKLFEDQYTNLWDNVDTIAEKIKQLDGDVSLSPQDQMTFSVIVCDPTVKGAEGFVRMLYNDHNKMLILLNKVFLSAQEENNQAIMNYIAERLDYHAKMRWFLRATIDRTI